MPDGTKNKHGPFRHADGFKRTLTFGQRTFTVLVSGAYDAGIVGPEDNGIAVLDEDNNTIVLDQHMIEETGYFGPSRRQSAEFERVCALDWKGFAAFCSGNPSFRGASAMPDHEFDRPNPVGKPTDRVVRERGPLDGADPYEAVRPLVRRVEIVEWLTAHAVQRDGNSHSPYRLAWSVPTYASGTIDDEHREGLDPAFDERWRAHLSSGAGEAMLSRELEDLLSHYLEGDYSLYDGSDGFTFGLAGRHGERMVLRGWNGPDPLWEDQKSMRAWLLDLDDASLVGLYTLATTLDRDLADPHAQISSRIAEIRLELESEWAADAAPAIGAR